MPDRERCGSTSAANAVAATAAAKITAATTATDAAAHKPHGAMGVTREHPLRHIARKLWSWRDEYDTERGWATGLGREALAAGETGRWEQLTAWLHRVLLVVPDRGVQPVFWVV
ncbi:hypothetical protein [Saccharopolyspora sp. 5N708]|uniref:hypothetical protein n=1 Tax=Saccharopolyspora sp. 5N708 TaxID=3457424 RepID=UPI003FD399E1